MCTRVISSTCKFCESTSQTSEKSGSAWGCMNGPTEFGNLRKPHTYARNTTRRWINISFGRGRACIGMVFKTRGLCPPMVGNVGSGCYDELKTDSMDEIVSTKIQKYPTFLSNPSSRKSLSVRLKLRVLSSSDSFRPRTLCIASGQDRPIAKAPSSPIQIERKERRMSSSISLLFR